MTKNSTHLQDVLEAPEGSHIAAFFDFDGTIIAGYSATAMLWEKFRRQEMKADELVETLNVSTQYRMGGVGFSGLMTAAAKFMKGVTEESYFEFGEELYEKHIARKVYPEARKLIKAHHAKGHTVAIVSSATIYQIEPTARDLDIEHVLCSQYEVENGEFTGNIIRPLCFGEGKVIAAEKLAERMNITLDKSYFYSDSDDDLDLLERVGKPRPLNPNSKLRDIAQERDWPLEKYDSRGRGTASEYIRSVYASASFLGTFVAGLPIWGLTGSQREAANFSTALFGDVAAALVGMKLDIHDEHNMWANRPCIFLFNHQSKADMMILSKLVRKDMAGLGKQEIRKIPIFGKVMELSGTVFIDRKNTANAIEAMAPLVDAMNKDGKSVIISPEGTRTLSPKLAPFKKGAFHLAMQAGVPVVPIVIHNAGDVSPKNEFLMRAANVRVDVLPPVDTSNWTPATINDHVAEVRNMFLRTLGQKEEEEALRELVAQSKSIPAKAASKRRSASKPTQLKNTAKPRKSRTPRSSPRKSGTSARKTSRAG